MTWEYRRGPEMQRFWWNLMQREPWEERFRGVGFDFVEKVRVDEDKQRARERLADRRFHDIAEAIVPRGLLELYAPAEVVIVCDVALFHLLEEEEQELLVEHVLSSLALTDDGWRVQKPDVFYSDLVRRRGLYTPELRRWKSTIGQLEFPEVAAALSANTVTFEMDGREPVTVTDAEFQRAAEALSGR